MQLRFECYLIEAKPDNLINDYAGDRDTPGDDGGEKAIEMMAPHGSNRRKCMSTSEISGGPPDRTIVGLVSMIVPRWECDPMKLLGLRKILPHHPLETVLR